MMRCDRPSFVTECYYETLLWPSCSIELSKLLSGEWNYATFGMTELYIVKLFCDRAGSRKLFVTEREHPN